MSQSGHNFHKSVLREYDIRGIVGTTLSAADAYAIGRAYATSILRGGGKTIALGFDGRLSSPELAQAVAEGLLSTGVHVKRVGLGPTPMLYFAIKHLHADAGIMVTGSHNPPTHNGFKMALYSGPVYGDAILEIGKIAASGDYAVGQGTIEDLDIQDIYVDRLVKDYAGPRDLKIVWDAGNGAAGEILRRMTAKLPGRHILLFDEIDGVRVNTADGWWLARASNTQEVLVARAEASSLEGLERLKAQLVHQLGLSGISPPEGF
jgi:phosphomannomutase